MLCKLLLPVLKFVAVATPELPIFTFDPTSNCPPLTFNPVLNVPIPSESTFVTS